MVILLIRSLRLHTCIGYNDLFVTYHRLIVGFYGFGWDGEYDSYGDHSYGCGQDLHGVELGHGRSLKPWLKLRGNFLSIDAARFIHENIISTKTTIHNPA